MGEQAPLSGQLSFRDVNGIAVDGSQALEAGREEHSFDYDQLTEDKPHTEPTAAQPTPYGEENLDKYMGMFTGGTVFKKKTQSLKIDASRLLMRSLMFMLAEYFLYLLLQLLSYFVFPTFWVSTTYVLGTVFLLLFIIVSSFLIRIQNRMDRLFPLILKSLEFVVYLILISWGVAYLDFSFLSLSYVVIFDLLALLLVVS